MLVAASQVPLMLIFFRSLTNKLWLWRLKSLLQYNCLILNQLHSLLVYYESYPLLILRLVLKSLNFGGWFCKMELKNIREKSYWLNKLVFLYEFEFVLCHFRGFSQPNSFIIFYLFIFFFFSRWRWGVME